MSAASPLDGLRVLDLSRLIPGDFCSAMLADLGAEVIKVEEPRVGDYDREVPPFIGGVASRFLIINRNKKSLSLNLKDPAGKEIFLELVAKSDVLLESFRPGALDKLGLGYEDLRWVNPGLVYCSISSFGQDGPYRDVVAHDINVLGLTGILDLTGTRQSGPVMSGVQIADSATAMNAAMGIMAALLKRARGGEGDYVDASMYDCALAWTFDAARYDFAGSEMPMRGEGRLWGGLPNYRLYRTKDDKYLAVGSLEAKFRQTLMDKLGRETGFAKEGGATTTEVNQQTRRECEELEQVFASKTQQEWLEELEGLNICVSPVLDMKEAVRHPQALHRKMVLDIEHPLAGRTRQLGSAFKFAQAEIQVDRLPAPRLGQHTAELLKLLGHGDQEIADLEARGVVRTVKN